MLDSFLRLIRRPDAGPDQSIVRETPYRANGAARVILRHVEPLDAAAMDASVLTVQQRSAERRASDMLSSELMSTPVNA
ncbi:MAG: hypothetical protein JSR41_00985 [Proteobacteria bacterium]|nr:hypothetical protein [Pseudomonadota bacterium]